MRITKENKFAVIAAICFAVIGGYYLYEYIPHVMWDVRYHSDWSFADAFYDFLFNYKFWMFPCYIAVTWTVLLMYRNKFAMRIAAGLCAAEVFVGFIARVLLYRRLNIRITSSIMRYFFNYLFTWNDGANLAWLLLFAALLLYKNKKWKALQWMWLLPGAVCALSGFVAYIRAGIGCMCGEDSSIRSLNQILYLNVFESGNDWFGYYGIIMSAVRLLAHFATVGAFVCIGLWLRREALRDACAGMQAANDGLVQKKWNRGAILGCALVGASIIASIVIGILVPIKYENQIKQSLAAGLYEEAEQYCRLLDENDADGKSAKIKYNYALSQIEQENYVGAYTVLCTLSYKDSEQKLLEIEPLYKNELFEHVDVGKPIYFGTYEQDNDTSNGKEDIEWRVLAKEGSKVLIISAQGLDCQPYNTSWSNVTWSSCSLRGWLNGTFLSSAFSAEEKEKILETKVSADKNPNYSTNPGSTTTDKVFLLSIDEANRYFGDDDERACDATAFAESIADTYTYGSWWLRTPGDSSNAAATVYSSGRIEYDGFMVSYENTLVRPALWITLD